eukprot:COSAG03_NODE_2851_length_2401_cov_20.948029_1_plen_159_part_10
MTASLLGQPQILGQLTNGQRFKTYLSTSVNELRNLAYAIAICLYIGSSSCIAHVRGTVLRGRQSLSLGIPGIPTVSSPLLSPSPAVHLFIILTALDVSRSRDPCLISTMISTPGKSRKSRHEHPPTATPTDKGARAGERERGAERDRCLQEGSTRTRHT